MLRIVSAIIGLLSAHCLVAQNLSPGSRRNILLTDLMNGLPIARAAPGVEGSIYFNSVPHPATITLKENNQVLEGVNARYNIHSQELDIETLIGERALDVHKVKSFVFKDTLGIQFINAYDYRLNGSPLLGFLEVMADGQVPLLKLHFLTVKNPDYNPALNSGSRNTRIIKEYTIYYADGKNLIEAKGKKKLLAFFGDKAEEIERFMKINHVSLSDQQGLIKVFTYYNSLLGKS